MLNYLFSTVAFVFEDVSIVDVIVDDDNDAGGAAGCFFWCCLKEGTAGGEVFKEGSILTPKISAAPT